MTAKRDRGIVGKNGFAGYTVGNKKDHKPVVGEGINFIQSGADTAKKIDNAAAQERKN